MEKLYIPSLILESSCPAFSLFFFLISCFWSPCVLVAFINHIFSLYSLERYTLNSTILILTVKFSHPYLYLKIFTFNCICIYFSG